MEQGSDEWFQARLGKATASRFKDVMTNGRGKDTMGQTAYSYMWELIAEDLTGQTQCQFSSAATEWGTEQEPHARAMYCLLHGVRVVKTSFFQHPHLTRVGGSPDGFVEGDADGPGGVEIKCPYNTHRHLQYLSDEGVPKEYEWQVQGLMWLTGRRWWDFVSYDPRLDRHGISLHVVRVRADDEMHSDLERRLARFIEQMEIKLQKIRSKRRE